MGLPAGYFDRERKIKTHEQMLDTLKARSRSAVGQSPKSLRWLDAVRATQRAEGAPYEVRGTRIKEGKDAGTVMYWAWLLEPKPKLLGYSSDVEIARAHCQTHFLNATKAAGQPVSETDMSAVRSTKTAQG